MIGRRFFLWLFGAASVAAPVATRADGYGAAFSARGQFPFVMIHPECGKPAFLLRRHPGYGGMARSADVAHLDGTAITPGSRPTCDSCGKPVSLSTSNIRENV